MRKRQQIIERIRTSWIQGVLEPSLADVPYIQLLLQQQQGGEPDQYDQEGAMTLSSNAHIIDIYHNSGGRLLILGEPGSGKTTLLLELLRDLLVYAEQDVHFPIPLPLNLSSWSRKRLPLEQWVSEELASQYKVKPFEPGQLLLLLDGLEEVEEDVREACVQALNSYQNTHNQVQMVVCCCAIEYRHLKVTLPHLSAVEIRPLTDEQIDAYLTALPARQDEIKATLSTDDVLHDVVRGPLWLYILAHVDQDSLHLDFSMASLAEKKHTLLNAYIRSRLQVPEKNNRYTLPDQLRWLAFLARQLYGHQQTAFRFKQIQRSWLPAGRWVHMYRIFMGIFVLCAAGLTYSLAIFDWRDISAIIALLVWLVLAVIVFVVWRLIIAENARQNISSLWLLVGFGWAGQFQKLLSDLSLGWISWFFIALSLPVIFVVVVSLPDRRLSYRPDDEFRQAIQYSIGFCLCSVLLLCLWGWLLHGFVGIWSGLRLGWLYGISAGLSLGGDVSIEHFILRFCLWRAKCLPWRYMAFLDDTMKRKLLYRVGDRYIFCNTAVFKYFLSLGQGSE
ncbi:NACHT domain-containing protein [Dictyobacter formicarum]|uniref:NACHT domain-containing protein n=1 Tax=Dictyobacter formicarum TaxID=2778368 RepID=UPI0019162B9D|nr:NACHT domain-containing protein [Dictyobacter formicarum]